jgi:hypothetical protein
MHAQEQPLSPRTYPPLPSSSSNDKKSNRDGNSTIKIEKTDPYECDYTLKRG